MRVPDCARSSAWASRVVESGYVVCCSALPIKTETHPSSLLPPSPAAHEGIVKRSIRYVL